MTDQPSADAAPAPWRLFVSLEVPADVRTALASVLAPVASANEEHLRFLPDASWHVTLAFIGEIHASWSQKVEQAIRLAAAGQDPFVVSLGRASRFGRAVLFLGFNDESYGRIRVLGSAVRDQLTEAGVPFDDQALHPHLTLARPRERRGIGVSRSRLQEVDEAVAPVLAQAHWPVKHLDLVRSHLRTAGQSPSYEVVQRFPLTT